MRAAPKRELKTTRMPTRPVATRQGLSCSAWPVAAEHDPCSQRQAAAEAEPLLVRAARAPHIERKPGVQDDRRGPEDPRQRATAKWVFQPWPRPAGRILLMNAKHDHLYTARPRVCKTRRRNVGSPASSIKVGQLRAGRQAHGEFGSHTERVSRSSAYSCSRSAMETGSSAGHSSHCCSRSRRLG